MKDARVAVIGAGEMGHGIAEVFAIGGYTVSLCDVDRKFLENAVRRIGESLEKLSAKGSIKEKTTDVSARISIHTSIKEAVSDARIVIEAVPEKEEIKAAVLKEVEKYSPAGTIIGSNTSNIRITALARNLADRTRMVGTHFFNPPVVMKLVEVVKGENTSDTVVEEVLSILSGLGKTPVLVHRDTPGFIVNRINAADLLFFGLLQDKGVATPEEIDAFGRGQGLPMGPYELLDFVGIDIVKHSLDYYAAELSPDYGKCRIYNELYSKNMLGKKTGRGFYDWSSGRPHIDSSKATDRVPLIDLFSLEINEAVKLIEEEVATPDEIETAVRLGMNRPFGPITVAKSLSNAEVKESLEKLSSAFGIGIFKPARSIEEGKLREAIAGRIQTSKTEVRGEKSEEGKSQGKQLQTGFEGSKVTVSRHGKVAVIAINNPRHNTIDADVLAGIEEAVDALWNDREITVIMIRGEGDSFSAGAQLSSFFRTAGEFLEFSRRGERTFRKLSEMPKITVAALKGYVLGGGFELSLSCDIRVASGDAKMGFPEVTLGLIPAWGGSQRLPKLVGMSRALNLILTGERIGAAEAKSIGLVSRIVGDADAEGLQFCQEIAGTAAPVAAMLAKRLINKGSEVASDVGLEMESVAAGILFSTEDLKEGISAFMQKRKPDFRGR
jgi:enoyl-CoA hydratase/3-hydroxyacyl-CoA dehydrogenase